MLLFELGGSEKKVEEVVDDSMTWLLHSVTFMYQNSDPNSLPQLLYDPCG